MAVKCRPIEASRVSVHVVLRESTSTSPDCSAVKRCCALSGVHLTLPASPSTAAASALQMSVSRPIQLPLLSTAENPGKPVLTPQAMRPCWRTVSSVLPACTAGDSKTKEIALMAMRNSFLREDFIVVLEQEGNPILPQSSVIA